MSRVIAYVDGFNLYFGLKSKGWQRYLWLDVQKLTRNLLRSDQTLARTKYFTARISRPAEKQKRQATYIEALQTLADIDIFFGKYQMNPRECRKCGFVDFVPNEKMTDVNIATELLVDAFQDKFDSALLMSADSDLVAPIEKVRRLFPGKKVIVAFPPARSSEELKKVASAYFVIGRHKIAESLFPAGITKPDGFTLTCPSLWT